MGLYGKKECHGFAGPTRLCVRVCVRALTVALCGTCHAFCALIIGLNAYKLLCFKTAILVSWCILQPYECRYTLRSFSKVNKTPKMESLIVTIITIGKPRFSIITERELTFTFATCRRPSVCRLSVTFARPTQAIEIFGNVSTPFGTLAIPNHFGKFHGDRPRGNPPSG